MQHATRLLLVEDDSNDTASVRRALEELAVQDRVIHVRSVEKALTYLATRPPEIPLLVLLDLEVPGTSGIHLLETMKRDKALMGIPVIVLTRSNAPRDIQDSFQYSIAGYLIKPRHRDKLLDAVRTIDGYWALCQMPTCA